MKHITRVHVAATLTLAAGLALAGCGNSDNAQPGGSTSSSSMPGMNHETMAPTTAATMTAPVDHNDSDVEFATGMIPHHRQAVEMADMALKQAKSASVKQLATAIKAAQDPEIQQMSGWLTGWGKPVPSPGMSHSMPGGGMMTEQEMTDLGKASGAAFDRMWVQMMIKHHQGAVAMAKTEQSSGESAKAIELAKKIEAAQNAEIATMQKLLNQLP
ncbi:DUF305 domain-containing protein [Kribbella albertanoniae]|uniref:DUF305 domain-containing protein n=1 Tax=Kribbella albertanoniae TaxID=1266829 RepID=A0A4R4QIH5_9ACTN|nr:DUF305 domain-containing protein [Kribbella albertanoniae]TDC35022.1 DUF305 domain-containing protein [Kribbella albertanoniae]